MTTPSFQRTTVAWLLAALVLSAGAVIILNVFSEETSGFHSVRADSYSRSAIGHRALIELLQGLGIPLVISHYRSAVKAGDEAPLVLLEPRLPRDEDARVEVVQGLRQDSRTVLLVLPKWAGKADPDHPDWIRTAGLEPPAGIDSLLLELGIDGRVVRPPADRPIPWTRNSTGIEPTLLRPQFLQSDSLRALIASDQGILLGETRTGKGRILVLSDPDLLNNQGLGRGANARLICAALDQIRRPGGGLVVDEALHGFGLVPSIWKAFFRLPLVLVLIQALLVALVFTWIALVRFGDPLTPPAPEGPGKRYLIRTIGELLIHGRRLQYVLQRYLQVNMQEAARRLHMPGTVSPPATLGWLEQWTRGRKLAVDLPAVAHEIEELEDDGAVSESRALRLAGSVHAWRAEVEGNSQGKDEGHGDS